MEKAKIVLNGNLPNNFDLDKSKVLFIDNNGVAYDAEIVTYLIENKTPSYGKGDNMFDMSKTESLNLLIVTINFIVTPDLYNGNYYLTNYNNDILYPMDLLYIYYYGLKE